MNRLFIIFFLLPALVARSQDKSFLVKLNNPDYYNSSIRLISDNDSGFALLSVVNKNYISRYRLSKNEEVTYCLLQTKGYAGNNNQSITTRSIDENILDQYQHDYHTGYVKNKILHELFNASDQYDFTVVETDLETGVSNISDTLVTSFKEKIFKKYVFNDIIYLLGYQTGTNKLVVYSKESKKPFSRIVINVNIDSIEKANKHPGILSYATLSGFLRNVKVFNEGETVPPALSLVRNKAYLWKNKLILSAASDNLKTDIINIDLTNGRLLYFRIDESKKHETKNRAFNFYNLIVDSIFTGAFLIKDSLQTVFYDITTGQAMAQPFINNNNYRDFYVTATNGKNTLVNDPTRVFRKIQPVWLELKGWKQNNAVRIDLNIYYDTLKPEKDIANIAMLMGAVVFHTYRVSNEMSSLKNSGLLITPVPQLNIYANWLVTANWQFKDKSLLPVNNKETEPGSPLDRIATVYKSTTIPEKQYLTWFFKERYYLIQQDEKTPELISIYSIKNP